MARSAALSNVSGDHKARLLDSEAPKSMMSHITLFVFFSFLFPALGGLMFGFDIGSTSVVKPIVEKQYTVVKNNSFMAGLFSSSSLIGALIGAILAFQFGDKLGRKRTLQFASSCYTLGSVISAAAPNLACVIAGKIVFGVGIACAMHSAPVYISEISPPEVRGFLVSLKEGIIVFGMVLGNFTGFVFHSGSDWRYIFATGAVLGAFLFIGMLFLPRSPRWLVLKDMKENNTVSADTRAVLARLRARPEEEVEAEIATIVQSLEGSEASTLTLLQTSKRQLLAALGLVFLQQVTGQPSVLYNTGDLLKKALGDSSQKAAAASCLVTTVKLFATLLSTVIVDKAGRKILLFAGIGLMTLATAGLTAAFQVFGNDANVLTIVILMCYVAGYQIGFGPIGWLLISEIFPSSVRSRAVSIAVFTNFLSNLLMTFFYPTLEDGLGRSMTFGLYCALCVVSIVFVAVFVPETRGKSLEQIEGLFYPNRQRQIMGEVRPGEQA